MKVELEHALAPFRIWNFGEHMVFRAEHSVMMKYVTKPPITGKYGLKPSNPTAVSFRRSGSRGFSSGSSHEMILWRWKTAWKTPMF